MVSEESLNPANGSTARATAVMTAQTQRARKSPATSRSSPAQDHKAARSATPRHDWGAENEGLHITNRLLPMWTVTIPTESLGEQHAFGRGISANRPWTTEIASEGFGCVRDTNWRTWRHLIVPKKSSSTGVLYILWINFRDIYIFCLGRGGKSMYRYETWATGSAAPVLFAILPPRTIRGALSVRVLSLIYLLLNRAYFCWLALNGTLYWGISYTSSVRNSGVNYIYRFQTCRVVLFSLFIFFAQLKIVVIFFLSMIDTRFFLFFLSHMNLLLYLLKELLSLYVQSFPISVWVCIYLMWNFFYLHLSRVFWKLVCSKALHI